MKTKLTLLVCSLAGATAVMAQPMLRMSQAALGPFVIAQGQNGPAQTVNTFNAGKGTLHITATSSVNWLVPTVGTSPQPCPEGSCVPVQIALQTSSLAAGAYTGVVTVSDPNAIDSPQTITVTVNIGTAVPGQLTLYAQPGGTASTQFSAGLANTSVSTQSGGNWLSVSSDSLGSFKFPITYTVSASAATLSAGDYNGSIALSGSSFAGDNKNLPVVLHVTTQPIAQASTARATFQIAQGAAAQTFPIVVTNGGQGTLSISSATVTTASGGNWLTESTNGNTVTLTADATNVTPGTYQGTVTVNTNAANSALTIPVQLTVAAAGPPLAYYGGAVNNGTFSPDDGLSQGDIVALFGQQFTSGAVQLAGAVPLPNTLGTTQVLFNGQPVPLYYLSSGQIDFEIPSDAPTGTATLQVVNNGQKGNIISLDILQRAPVIDTGGGTYAVAQNAQGAPTGIPGSPAHAGDVVVVYMFGLGPTSPSVPSGTAAPSAPGLANVNAPVNVCFGSLNPFGPPANCVAAQFAGLTPGLVALYQVNFQIPQNVSAGNSVPFFVTAGDSTSNVAHLVIQ